MPVFHNRTYVRLFNICGHGLGRRSTARSRLSGFRTLTRPPGYYTVSSSPGVERLVSG